MQIAVAQLRTTATLLLSTCLLAAGCNKEELTDQPIHLPKPIDSQMSLVNSSSEVAQEELLNTEFNDKQRRLASIENFGSGVYRINQSELASSIYDLREQAITNNNENIIAVCKENSNLGQADFEIIGTHANKHKIRVPVMQSNYYLVLTELSDGKAPPALESTDINKEELQIYLEQIREIKTGIYLFPKNRIEETLSEFRERKRDSEKIVAICEEASHLTSSIIHRGTQNNEKKLSFPVHSGYLVITEELSPEK